MKTKHLVWKNIYIKITFVSFPLCPLFSYIKPHTNEVTTLNWELQPAFHTTNTYAHYPLEETLLRNLKIILQSAFVFLKFVYNNSMSTSECQEKKSSLYNIHLWVVYFVFHSQLNLNYIKGVGKLWFIMVDQFPL